MHVKRLCFNMMDQNTYVVSDDSGECVIIDCGCSDDTEQKQLADYIERNNLQVKHLLCTHFHLDHTFGNKFALEKFNLQAEVNEGDRILAEMIHYQAVAFGLSDDQIDIPAPIYTLSDGAEISFGNTKLTVITTPGHSPGSVSLYSQQDGILFSGDTIFKGAFGAVNLPGGRLPKLYRSITQKIFTLPEETVIYPGHGESTLVGVEKETNPILFVDGVKKD
ncbi:MAG: MBL fold metallo-hydrolase [Bacteroidales bacterium]|nr:MBL fold metallo-hydrolase [Bacteroidales bacterium]